MNVVFSSISKWLLQLFNTIDNVPFYGDISLLDMFLWIITVKMIFMFVSMFLLPTTGEVKEHGKGVFRSLRNNARNNNSSQGMGISQINSNRKHGNK